MDINNSATLNISKQEIQNKLSFYDWMLALVGFTVALVVYLVTLTPSLSYLSPDGSELATVPYILGLAHSPGYPFYTFMGFIFSHLLPFGDVAHRMNMMSAILGAMGVGGLYLIICRLLPGNLNGLLTRAIALMSTLLFAFSPDFWSQTLIAEVYAANIGLIAITLLALLWWERSRRYLVFFLFALTFGISLGTHISNLGFAPAFVIFILLTIFLTKKPSRTKQFLTKTAPSSDTRELYKIDAADETKDLNKSLQSTPTQMQTSHIRPFVEKTKELLGIAISGFIGFMLGILQFAWLPLRAGTLNDRIMLRSEPTTLAGIYKYTLGAFPNFKFAFPINVLPIRIVQYLNFIRIQYALIGLALGLIGLIFLLFKRPRHYFLLVCMYLVHIWFFIQYNVFDLEVFYIPAHFLWAIFIGFGVWGSFWTIKSIFKVKDQSKLRYAVYPIVIFLLLVPSIPLAANFSAHNYSGDTSINDFYANVWEYLPENSAFLTSSGVFGYDAFYWQLAYQTRSDVFLPMLPGPQSNPEQIKNLDLYANISSIKNKRGPGAVTEDLISPDSWVMPVLFGEQPASFRGQRIPLILYHITETPPELILQDVDPAIAINETLGKINLIGMDIDQAIVESGDSINVVLYWQYDPDLYQRLPRVETAMNGMALEQHELGFGLLQKYVREIGLQRGDIIQEKYALVIPSDIEVGLQEFSIHLASFEGAIGPEITLTTIEVQDQEGMFERWLRIAKDSD